MSTNIFRRSSFCTDGGSCVEVRIGVDGISVRDSKDDAATPLHFDAAEWSAFLKGVKNGEFDI